jgi:serine-protein kinase ATM
MWMAELRTEHPTNIMSDYLEKAAHLSASDNAHNRGKIFHRLAKYADDRYHSQIKYDCISEIRNVIAQHESDLEILEGSIAEKIKLQLDTVKAKSNRYTQDLKTFLEKSVEYYLVCLEISDKFDISVFRVCYFWFSHNGLDSMNDLIAKFVDKIPSHKWVILMFQLAARMNSNNEKFRDTLLKLVERICRDHPYHGLYQILALQDARYADLNKDRTKAASEIINRLQNDRRLGEIINDIETLRQAYMEFHDTHWVESKRIGTFLKSTPIKKTTPILQLKHKPNIPVPTLNLPPEPQRLYRNIIYIKKFKDTFQYAGGTRNPMILECEGSDGQCYKQLVS